MAKFPIQMSGVEVYDIEGLKKHFELNALLENRHRLSAWLKGADEDELALQVKALSANISNDTWLDKVGKILGMEAELKEARKKEEERQSFAAAEAERQEIEARKKKELDLAVEKEIERRRLEEEKKRQRLAAAEAERRRLAEEKKRQRLAAAEYDDEEEAVDEESVDEEDETDCRSLVAEKEEWQRWAAVKREEAREDDDFHELKGLNIWAKIGIVVAVAFFTGGAGLIVLFIVWLCIKIFAELSHKNISDLTKKRSQATFFSATSQRIETWDLKSIIWWCWDKLSSTFRKNLSKN